METTRNKYSMDFKIKAVELSNHRGIVKSVAKELNIPTDNLRKCELRWRIKMIFKSWKSNFSLEKVMPLRVIIISESIV
jgi:hypothetical protein